MLKLLAAAMEPFGVTTQFVQLADHDIKPGVTSDEGDGDAWPAIRQKILDADILIMGTPIWMGQPSSVCKRALERMDAFLEEKDDEGRMVSYGRVAAVAVVGNEDGAHHVSAELFQALNDVGFTIPANAVTYWVGEAMGSVNFVDLEEIPEAVRSTLSLVARNTVHAATLLKARPIRVKVHDHGKEKEEVVAGRHGKQRRHGPRKRRLQTEERQEDRQFAQAVCRRERPAQIEPVPLGHVHADVLHQPRRQPAFEEPARHTGRRESGVAKGFRQAAKEGQVA
jgi:multimeric flavodoxin WrbA